MSVWLTEYNIVVGLFYSGDPPQMQTVGSFLDDDEKKMPHSEDIASWLGDL
jgi:hypothetical protein